MPRYTESEARAAVASSFTYAEVLRKLGLRTAGGNHKLLRRWVDDVWQIPTEHFDQDQVLRQRATSSATPLETILVEHSTYHRGHLKRRLYAAGLKVRICELCGQGEMWRGRYMGLVLDHVNGVPDDNRLENLRIVCPNCNATFETHCGRQNKLSPEPRACLHCGADFQPRYPTQRYCSRHCGCRSPGRRRSHPELRKAERPAYDVLIAELTESNWSAVGRKYGVSDNAVRKWVRWYEADAQRRGEGRAEDHRDDRGPSPDAAR